MEEGRQAKVVNSSKRSCSLRCCCFCCDISINSSSNSIDHLKLTHKSQEEERDKYLTLPVSRLRILTNDVVFRSRPTIIIFVSLPYM